MSLFGFGKPRQKGISAYELKENGARLTNRLHSAFKGAFSTRQRKQDILDAALHMTGDRDYGAPSNQKEGVVTKEEFDGMVQNYEEKGIFTKDEAERLRAAAKDALKD